MDHGFALRLKMQILMYLERFLMIRCLFEVYNRKSKTSYKQNCDTFVQVLIFLDVSYYLHQSGWLEIGIFYKETSLQNCLNYFSHHPEHTKQNISYNLVRHIIVFLSDETRMIQSLSELRTWSHSCS